MKIMVTGGAGFIGAAVCRRLIRDTDHAVVNIDKLTYAASLEALADVADDPRYSFHRLDICDGPAVAEVMRAEQIDAVMHLAAESHVDRSIDGPSVFMQTNIMGTYALLEAVRAYLADAPDARRDAFRFHHISTDEVFGALPLEGGAFSETTPYDPSSPYSASKAAADHLVRAWGRTYGVPVILTNCSNNYGPYHFPEKLIPLMITNAVDERALPVYGAGRNVRDWLYVDDHAAALVLALTSGVVGRSYNVGGGAERSNIDVVRAICRLMDKHHPRRGGGGHEELITFVQDRPGHDLRYAIDASRIRDELGWRAVETFDTGLEKTVLWYLDNEPWWRPIRESRYRGERLGQG